MALVEIVHKLKVSMEVLLGKDQESLKKIQYLYYNKVSILPDSDESDE